MLLESNRWERRFEQVVKLVAWLTLAFGVWESLTDNQDSVAGGSVDSSLYLAVAASGAYVISITVIPSRFLLYRRTLVVEAVAVLGSALTMTAVGLTGAAASPYYLLSLTPVLYGALFGTLRVGIATAALSASLVLVQSYGAIDNSDIAQAMGFYFLVGLTFSQARRILVAEALRATAAAEAFESAQLRLSQLENANDLLTRLSTLADSRELNPIEVGDVALDALYREFPINSGMTALASDQGQVIVARRGQEAPDDAKSTIPLRVGDREVGMVMVTTDEPFTETELRQAEESLRPIALAFANVQLLQDIARRAIHEERARLARELHDEIGPSLASLGLAVDLAILQNPTEPALSSHLQHLRTSVSGLVEEIRATVADLREDEQPSLTEAVKDAAQHLDTDDVIVEMKLDERRPPRPSIASDVIAIVSEAFRNAIRHSGAATITVHGTSDFDTGDVTVHDDGSGFDPDRVPTGHFGLIGMKERADKIGAALNVTTGQQGTAVSVTWGPK